MSGVDKNPERRRYYPDQDDTPLSTAIYEAIEAHEQSSLIKDELDLYEYVNPDAIDTLFSNADDGDIDISVQFNLTNITVSVWSDGGIEIRVSEKLK